MHDNSREESKHSPPPLSPEYLCISLSLKYACQCHIQQWGELYRSSQPWRLMARLGFRYFHDKRERGYLPATTPINTPHDGDKPNAWWVDYPESASETAWIHKHYPEYPLQQTDMHPTSFHQIYKPTRPISQDTVIKNTHATLCHRSRCTVLLHLLQSIQLLRMRVCITAVLCVFPEVFFRSRVIGACPSTDARIRCWRRVNPFYSFTAVRTHIPDSNSNISPLKRECSPKGQQQQPLLPRNHKTAPSPHLFGSPVPQLRPRRSPSPHRLLRLELRGNFLHRKKLRPREVDTDPGTPLARPRLRHRLQVCDGVGVVEVNFHGLAPGAYDLVDRIPSLSVDLLSAGEITGWSRCVMAAKRAVLLRFWAFWGGKIGSDNFTPPPFPALLDPREKLRKQKCGLRT